MWPIKTILFAVLYAGLCVGSLFDPTFGVMNYVMIYQIDPQGAWWGIPLRDLGLRFSLIAALFMLAGMVVRRSRPRLGRPCGRGWELGIVTLVVIALFSVLTGVGYTQECAARLDKFLKLMLFVLVMGRLITTREQVRRLLWIFVLGTMYLGHQAYIAGPSRFHLGRLNDIGGPDFQFSSGFAVHLAAVLPLVGAAFLIARSWIGRIWALVTGALGFNAMILCRTRSAFVGLAAGAAVAALVAPRQRRFRIVAMLAVCSVAAMTLTDSGFWQRMITITDPKARETDTAVVTRLDVWKVGLRMIADHPLGVGAGNFERMTRSYYYERRAAHNTFLNCVAELGIPAGFIFFCMLFSSFWRLRRAMHEAEGVPGPLELKYIGYGTLVSMVTYVVAGFFTERFYTESFWWVLTLPLCVERTVSEELARMRAGVLAPRLEAAIGAADRDFKEWEHDAPTHGCPSRAFA